jgi:hypothetical protein
MEYVGPIEIKIIPNKGRGIFATQNIPKGTLIVVEKAIAICRINPLDRADPISGHLSTLFHASN